MTALEAAVVVAQVAARDDGSSERPTGASKGSAQPAHGISAPLQLLFLEAGPAGVSSKAAGNFTVRSGISTRRLTPSKGFQAQLLLLSVLRVEGKLVNCSCHKSYEQSLVVC